MGNQDKKIIMIISPMVFPIPAIGGGAVETLITNLLNENEKRKLVKFIVVSNWDPKIDKNLYSETQIYYFKNGLLETKKYFCVLKYKLSKLFNFIKRKFFLNRLTYKFFKDKVHLKNSFIQQCLYIAKKNKVDFLVSEEYTDFYSLKPLIKTVGRENVYYHIHRALDEIHDVRELIPNSISISNYVRNRWVIDKSILGRNCVAHNCIDEKIFIEKIDLNQRNAIRSSLGIKQNDILVLYVGRIIQEKGVKELINAFEIIKNPRIKLLLIGSVNFSISKDTDFSREIIKKIEKLPNIQHIGYIENKKLRDFYLISDMQVVPSVCQEGAGLVAIEGMTAGLPLIVTRSGGMIEYVNNDCAIQLDINSHLSNELAKAIQYLADSPEKRCQMGRASLKRANDFSCSIFYNEFITAFNINIE